MICLCSNCHTQWDGNEIGIHPRNNTLIIAIAIEQEVTQSGKTYTELSGMKIHFKKPDPPFVLLKHRHQYFKRMLVKEAINARLLATRKRKRKRKESALLLNDNDNDKKSDTQKVKKTTRSKAK